MRAAWEEGLAAVERIIATAEQRRVEQMIHIAVLLAEEGDAAETQEELRRTERLLKIMRTQRSLLIGAHSGPRSEGWSVDPAIAAAAQSGPPAPDFAPL
jgi:hypothetical protein